MDRERLVGLLPVWRRSGTTLKLLGRGGGLVLKTNECSGWVLDIGKSSCSERSRYILNGLELLFYTVFVSHSADDKTDPQCHKLILYSCWRCATGE
jgi:hypothetical protein